MANNVGTLVLSPVRPYSDQDTFATSFANEIKGGHHSVDTIAERNAITAERLQDGMTCYVASEKTTYELVSGVWLSAYRKLRIHETANTYAQAVSLATGDQWKEIKVIADETAQGGQTYYRYDGVAGQLEPFSVSIEEEDLPEFISRIQPETSAFVRKHLAVNSILPADTIDAIDGLIAKMKAVNAYHKIAELALFVGSNLNGALIKLKAGAGSPDSLINHGLTPGELDGNGIGPDDVTSGKWLETGFTPSVAGISPDNCSIGLYMPVKSPSYNSYYLPILSQINDVIPTDGNQLALGPFGGSIGSHYNEAPRFGCHMISLRSGGNGTGSGFLESVRARYFGLGNGLAAFNAPISLFRTTQYSKQEYSKGKCGGYYIASNLTEEEHRLLDSLIMDVNFAIDRPQFRDRIGIVGDSIGVGAGGGSAFGEDSFAAYISKRIGAGILNLSAASALMAGENNGFPLATIFMKTLETKRLNLKSCIIEGGANDLGVDDTLEGDPAKINLFKAYVGAAIEVLQRQGTAAIVMSIPYLTIHPMERVRAYVMGQLEMAKQTGAIFVDCLNIFLDLDNPGSMQDDGIHPTGDGHKMIAEAIINAVVNRVAIRKPRLDFPSVAAFGRQEMNIEILGVTTSTPITVSSLELMNAGLLVDCRVTADNIVTIRVTNLTNAAIDMPKVPLLVQASLI